MEATSEEIAARFSRLEGFVEQLGVLSCLARSKQAEAVATLKERFGLSTEGAAKHLKIEPEFARRLVTFHQLMAKFKMLAFTGYSFETLVKYKKWIEQKADENEDFHCKLEVDVTVEFEGENDDELMEAVTDQLESSGVDGFDSK